ncbi:MAG: outer membrane beta-barrel protein [Myxococcales bacterium]|nr:outer membrane beta-barrel protein [Myxococcales bacterium]
MKKQLLIPLLVLAALLMMTGSSFAWGVTAKDNPFAAGKFMLNLSSGLDFGMGTDTFEPEDGDEVETDIAQFGAGVQGGYFILKGWELGPALRYDYRSVTDEDDNITSTSEAFAGIQTGYYYATPIPVHPFINVEVGYDYQGLNNEPDEGDSTSDTAGGFAVRPSLGAVFFFADEIALTPSVYYQYTSLSGTDDTSGTEFDYDATSSRFGLQIGLTGIF